MLSLLNIALKEVPVCSQLLLIGHLLLTINSSVNFPVYYLGNCRKVVRLLLSLCGVKTLLMVPSVHSDWGEGAEEGGAGRARTSEIRGVLLYRTVVILIVYIICMI